MTFWTFQKTFSRQLADWLVGVNNHANFCESTTHLEFFVQNPQPFSLKPGVM